MPVPAKRRPRSSKRRRASHFALSHATLIACPKCKKLIAPHRVCDFCGFYKGREVIAQKSEKAIKKEAAKAEKKSKKAEGASSGKETPKKTTKEK